MIRRPRRTAAPLDLFYASQKLDQAMSTLDMQIGLRERVVAAYIHYLHRIGDRTPPVSVAPAFERVFGILRTVAHFPSPEVARDGTIKATLGKLPDSQLEDLERAIRDLATIVERERRA